MRLRINHDEITGGVEISVYERREDGQIVVFDDLDCDRALPVCPGATLPHTFTTTEDRLVDLFLAHGKAL